ncbi:hypothetical protein KGQ71_03475 [Patescibacteria group bacterium]|nr:hypothetical protein [Patescibacteria group bacterium]
MTYQTWRQRTLGLMGALMLDAILGIALTTVINFDPSKPSTVQDVFLVLHILIAVGIIVGGIIQLVLSIRKRVLRLPITIGFISSLLAFGAGGISADNGNSVAVFIMAVCFIIALAAYGYSQTQLSNRLSTVSVEHQ